MFSKQSIPIFVNNSFIFIASLYSYFTLRYTKSKNQHTIIISNSSHAQWILPQYRWINKMFWPVLLYLRSSILENVNQLTSCIFNVTFTKYQTEYIICYQAKCDLLHRLMRSYNFVRSLRIGLWCLRYNYTAIPKCAKWDSSCHSLLNSCWHSTLAAIESL